MLCSKCSVVYVSCSAGIVRGVVCLLRFNVLLHCIALHCVVLCCVVLCFSFVILCRVVL